MRIKRISRINYEFFTSLAQGPTETTYGILLKKRWVSTAAF